MRPVTTRASASSSTATTRRTSRRRLNVALPECRGEIVGVFDAEDVVATGAPPGRRPDVPGHGSSRSFRAQSSSINYRSSWFSARNVLEYYFWFRSRLHYQARAGFIPLGGNTVFVRRSWLDAAGGWDENCLAEDCDLGVRLSARRARTVVAYTPALATREETPETIAALVQAAHALEPGLPASPAEGRLESASAPRPRCSLPTRSRSRFSRLPRLSFSRSRSS